MLIVLQRQIHEHLLSVRFQLGFLVLFGFFTATSALYDLRLDSLQRDMVQIHTGNEDRYDGFTSVSKALWGEFRVQSSPPGTEFIAEGHIEHLTNAMSVYPRTGELPGPDHGITSNNVLLPYDHVDWTWILRYVLSFLCIVLAFDALSGERETGTLRLLMANPLSRLSVAAGKCLGNAVVLVGSLFAASAFGLFYLSLTGAIELNSDIWSGYLTFLLVATIYILLFTSFAIGVSALADQSSTAVVILILAWVVFIVIIPQSSALIASQVTGEQRGRWGAWEVLEDEYESLREEGILPRGRDVGRTDNYAVERVYGRRMEAADARSYQYIRDVEGRLLRQYYLARNISLLSPGYAMQFPLEALLGTGVIWREHFHREADAYRDVLREFLQQQDSLDPDSPHILFQSEYMSDAELDPEQIPRFHPRPLDLATRLSAAMEPLIALLLETLAAIVFAGWATHRMEIGTQ